MPRGKSLPGPAVFVFPFYCLLSVPMKVTFLTVNCECTHGVFLFINVEVRGVWQSSCFAITAGLVMSPGMIRVRVL